MISGDRVMAIAGIAGSAKGVTPTLTDSEDDEADKDLFLDWRGKGPGTGVGFVQQSLGFEQVGRRFPDAVKTMVSKHQQDPWRDETRKSEVNRSYENVVFVSLSDDDEPRPTRTGRKDTKVSTSVKHAGPSNASMLQCLSHPHNDPEGVVCLDSDSEPESPSIGLKGEGSAKFGRVEEPVVRRSWEKASCSKVVRVVHTVPGPSKPYDVTPPDTVSNGVGARKDPSSAILEECSNKTSESSKLDKLSPPSKISASSYENAIGSRSSGVLTHLNSYADSSSRHDTTEIEYISSEERVLNFKKILEGAGVHDDSIARSLRSRGNTAERETALSVYDFEDETVPYSRVVSGSSSPAQGPVITRSSEGLFASTSVTSALSKSLSRARESQEKLNIASNIIIEDLTTSDNDDELRNPCCSGSSYKDERVASGSEMYDLYSGEKRTWGKNCKQSQEWLRQENLSRVAGTSVDELSAGGGPKSSRLHALKDTGGSSGDERYNSTQVSTSHTSGGLEPAIRNSGVRLCDFDISDEENIAIQIPSKRKCIRSAEDPMVERSINLDAGDFDSHRTNLPVKGTTGRKCLSSNTASSAFEAVKTVIELEKLEKKREREREQEARNKLKEEDKKRRQEETRKKKEELRQQKEAAKAEAAERKKIEQECVKWKRGKFALENTTVYIDKRIIESKNLGPPLLQQLASKEYNYQVVTNRVEKTVVWTMKMPPDDSKAILDARESQDEPISNSQLPLEEVEIKYVVVLLEAAEFADMVAADAVDNHINGIKKEHRGYTICYLVNNLTRYIYKKEQTQYRTGDRSWKRPNVEQVLAEFITNHIGVRSRLCIDENEMAEHIIGLTRSLAESPFMRKLTSLAINANGDHIAKNDPHREVIKRDPWKKALAAIPNITGAAVIAITKVYPTMRALLNAYLDPTKTVLEKEFLLQDIVKDAALGSARAEGRRVGPVCSKRIYRLLMAQNGNLRTEAAEEGEDYFRDQQC